MRRSKSVLPVALAAGAIVVLLLAGVGVGGNARSSGAPAAARAKLPPLPRVFEKAYNAHAVGDRARLWVVASGDPDVDGALSVETLSTDGKQWSRAAGIGRRLDRDAPLSVVMPTPGAPCVGGTERRRPYALCREAEQWTDTQLRVRSGERLIQLFAAGGILHALLSTPGGRHRVLVRAAGAWSRLGPALSPKGAIAKAATGAGAVTVAVAQGGRRPSRSVHRLEGGRWRRVGAALQGVGYGPFPGTPSVLGERVLLPVTDAARMPWRFSVFALERGRWRASTGVGSRTGAGSAQGTIGLAAGAAWAIWQENRQRGERFATRMYAQRLGRGARSRLLWRGTSLGPSDIEVVDALGGAWGLFMPDSGNGLEVRIASLQ